MRLGEEKKEERKKKETTGQKYNGHRAAIITLFACGHTALAAEEL